VVVVAGYVRALQQMEKRLKEAERLGFTRALVAGRTRATLAGGNAKMKIEEVDSLREAVQLALVADLERESF
jgi:predicted ATP-dependent serine protease